MPGLYEALTGGSRASDAEERIAARVSAIGPLTRTMLNGARAHHARAAASAAARGMPVAAVQCGYPGFLALHADPAGRRHLLPDGRPLPVVYAAAEGHIAQDVRSRLADPHDGIRAVQLAADDTAGLMAVPEIADAVPGRDARPRPVQLHLPMVLQWLDAGTCGRLLREYAALLPSGSQIVITAAVGLTTPLGLRWADLASEAGELQSHTLEDLYAWCEQAGLWLEGPPTDARARGIDWAAGRYESAAAAAMRTGRRTMAVTARVPETLVQAGGPGDPQVTVLGPDEWVIVPQPAGGLSPARLGAAVGRHPGAGRHRRRDPVSFRAEPGGSWPAVLPGPAVLHYADGHAVVRCRPGQFDGRAAHVLSQAGSLAASVLTGQFGNPSLRVARAPHSDRGPWHPAACEPGPGGLVVTLCENLLSASAADVAGRLLRAHLGQLARSPAAGDGDGRLLAS